MRKASEKNIPVAVLLGCVFALMLLLNFQTGLSADDYLFHFSRAHWGRIGSVRDILISLRAMRQHVNGRVFAHFFVYYFLLRPKALFNFVNAAVSTLLFYIIYRYIRSGEKKRDLLLLVFLLAAVFLLLPAFGQVFLWLSGACNYSWTILVTLLFLLPFFRAFMQREPRPLSGGASRVLRVLYLLLAFVAGAWSENGALAMLCAAFFFLVLTWRRERRLPPFLTAAFLTACGGFLFLMLAPSELNGRRGEVSESTLTKAASRLWAALSVRFSSGLLLFGGLLALVVLAVLILLLIRRRRLGCRLCTAVLLIGTLAGAALLFPRGAGFPGTVALLVSDTRLSLLLALALYLLLLLRAWEQGVAKNTLLAAVILGISAVGSVAVFLFAVYFPARSACPFIFYTTLADALLLSGLWETGRFRPLRSAAAVTAVLALLLLPLAVWDIFQTGAQSAARDALLRDAAADPPAQQLVIEPLTPATKYSPVWPGDEEYFTEDIVMYYGLPGLSISGVN